jgi:hypothetical protein
LADFVTFDLLINFFQLFFISNICNFAKTQYLCTAKNERNRVAFLRNKIAKIAQLVEHNLAKVRVAGSSPVFRSGFNNAKRNSLFRFFSLKEYCAHIAQMVKLVDTLVSGTSGRKAVQVRVLFWAQYAQMVKLVYTLL